MLHSVLPCPFLHRYAEAILSCVQQLGLLASGQTPEPGGVDSDDGLGIFLFFLGSTAAVMGWAWLSNRKRSKRYKVGVIHSLFEGTGRSDCACSADLLGAVRGATSVAKMERWPGTFGSTPERQSGTRHTTC
jgi:hypothetical protein